VAAAVSPVVAAASAAAAREENGDMKPQEFIGALDTGAIEAAIQQAERQTSGEIRVVVSKQAVADPVAAAREEFARQGMTKTRRRNAVLLFIAPVSQGFAIIGDEGVHAKCGDAFWTEVAGVMQKNFRDGQHTAALLEGIARGGELLAAHFPPEAGDTNELPDQVIER
jgi:uncharacterized membrane protein